RGGHARLAVAVPDRIRTSAAAILRSGAAQREPSRGRRKRPEPGKPRGDADNLGSGNLLNLELSALEADDRGKVVSSPRIITSNNQKASIVQGTQIPYSTGGGGS